MGVGDGTLAFFPNAEVVTPQGTLGPDEFAVTSMWMYRVHDGLYFRVRESVLAADAPVSGDDYSARISHRTALDPNNYAGTTFRDEGTFSDHPANLQLGWTQSRANEWLQVGPYYSGTSAENRYLLSFGHIQMIPIEPTGGGGPNLFISWRTKPTDTPSSSGAGLLHVPKGRISWKRRKSPPGGAG